MVHVGGSAGCDGATGLWWGSKARRESQEVGHGSDEMRLEK